MQLKRVLSKRSSRAVLLLAALALALGAAAPAFGSSDQGPAPASAQGGPGSVHSEAAEKVLILDPTVSGGINSVEAEYAASLGFGVDVKSASEWGAMSAADFASYRAIILGDPTCDSGQLAAAVANVGTWVPVVNGNVIVIGTDPVFHHGSHPGATTLIQKGIDFALGQSTKVGLYLDLSCSGTTEGLPILNALSNGWTLGEAGCGDEIHIVATNPFLAGLTDADLSGWSCSVHEYATVWPTSDFVPIALDTNAPPNFTSSDGFSGSPYILGRGTGLTLGNILLSPDTGTQDTSKTYDLTALVQEGGTPKSGVTVTFTCHMDGQPDMSGPAVTDANGNAKFTYARPVAGTDTCSAFYIDSKSVKQTSNDVTVVWTSAAPPAVIQPTFTG